MLRIELEGMLEVGYGAGRVLRPQLGKAAAVAGIHHELRPVQLAVAAAALPGELRLCFGRVPLRETDDTEQPVKAASGIALLQMRLAVLHDGALAEHRLGAIEVAPGDMNHGDFEVREREVGIEVQ